uniref:NADH dehydrogenase subunit 2 n=1 Tax=Amblyomma dubitatum TaxID=321419 RepID=UPI002E75B4D0|nr:NADH dehydrogenase subunit 2 [Amblyomma dubitatum]WQF69004.1 NADH dehydrogenase subunit 2 [Amblyomma dubitatum]
MFFKYLMKWLILITIIITISSNSWFIYWLMMELNLLMFIPVMNSKKKNNANTMISYFIIQAFSSTLFFYSGMNFLFFKYQIFNTMMTIALLIKLAAIPFHFWLTGLSEMISHNSLLIILTLQKFIPLFILSTLISKILIIFALISSIFGSIFAINIKILKKILIFSSISHQGWMMTLIFIKSNFWLTYMLIYSLLIFKILLMLEENNSNSIMNFMQKNKNPSEKFSFSMLMMSLGGMPPFLGFMIKFISVMIIIKFNNTMVMILILSSMINIFFYIRMISPNLFMFSMNLKNLLKIKHKTKNLIFNLNALMSIFLINILMI